MANLPVQRSALDEYVASLALPEYAVGFEVNPNLPLVRYAKDVTVIGGRRDELYTGWHIGVEQSDELDGFFEMQGIPCVRVRHRSGKEEAYWQLDSLSGYLLMKSVPIEYGPESYRKTGIPYVWNNHQGTYMCGSQMQCLFFLKGLLDLGYAEPLALSLSRTVTEPFIQRVLRRQGALLEAIKAALRKHGKTVSLASYSYWVELAKDTELFVTKKGGKYFPPIATIEITPEYVRGHQADPAHLAIIEAFVPAWDTWAESTSKQLMEPPRDAKTAEAGEEEQEETKPKEGTKPASPSSKGAKLEAKPDYKNNPDPTIPIASSANGSSEALYNAVWKNKQDLLSASFEDKDWLALLRDLQITEIANAKHIAAINKAVRDLLREIEQEGGL